MRTNTAPVPESTAPPRVPPAPLSEVGLRNRLAEIGGRQLGVVSNADLCALGATRDTILHLRRSGRIVQLHRGVYLVGHDSIPEWGREYAATVATGPDSYVSHYSAARIWGLIEPYPDAPINITTVRRRLRHKHEGVKCHSTARLERLDRYVFKELIPVTSPARTILDLAAVASLKVFENALGAALIAKVCERSRLFEVVMRYPRHPGARRLKNHLLSNRAQPTRSPLERRFLRLLERAHIPAPEVNSLVAGIEVDCFWPHFRLAVELDGRAFHSHDEQIERDMERDVQLASERITVLRISWRQVTRDGLATANRIRQLMGMPVLDSLPGSHRKTR